MKRLAAENPSSFTCKFNGKEFHKQFHERLHEQFHDADVSVLLHKGETPVPGSGQTPEQTPGPSKEDDEQQWLLFSLIGRKKFRNWLQQWFCDQIDD